MSVHNFYPFASVNNIQQLYYVYPNYWDGQHCVINVDPDQMPQNVASDEGLI